MNAADRNFDCIVIGAGIAGASVAAELSASQSVLVLERESQPGYHTTGRSAALYTTAYGPPVIRALTRASGNFFNARPAGPDAPPLLHPRGAAFVARPDQMGSLAKLRAELGDAVSDLTADQLERMVPLLRPGYARAGLFDRTAADIDVHALHQHYLRATRDNGGHIACDAGVLGLLRLADRWRIETLHGTVSAPVVINASGAWADEIAQLAGVAPLGLIPKRRTALIVPPPPALQPDTMPMVVDADESFYMKPDAGKLLISPADETPSPPCDAQPDELDIAICVDRIERAFNLSVRRIESKWAGLRNFLPDGGPIAAYDGEVPGFFWLAGQGGYGIQSAPALARAAAALVQSRPLPADIADEGVTEASLGRDREGLAA